MERGFVPLYRKIADNPLWLSEPFTRAQAWVDLLIIANHKDNICFIRGNKLKVKRGQVGWAEKNLAARWKWSRGKVARFLKLLENEQQIEQQKSKLTTLITIKNYEHYNKNEQQNGQQTDNRRTTDGQQTDINKNVKNVKNVKKEDICSEPDGSKPESAVDIILNTKEMYPISKADIAEWQKLFPAVDVMGELRKMAAWAKANPNRRKTRRGISRFIVSWLSKEQDRGRKVPAVLPNAADHLTHKQKKEDDEWRAIFSQT
jgi:hypothetical protein